VVKSASTDDQFVALLLLAALAFSPPLLAIFGVPELVFGVPVLFLYLFGAWAALIGLLAFVSGRAEETEPPGEKPD
jgi:hypothetical protein